MTPPPLKLCGAESLQSAVFWDERKNLHYFASVTLEGRDESWGHFLSQEDIERLRDWCAELLGDR